MTYGCVGVIEYLRFFFYNKYKILNKIKIATSIKFVFIKYLSSNLLFALVSIFVGFINYRHLEPSSVGLWTSLTLIEGYSSMTRLGILNGLGRELPFYLGNGNKTMAYSLAESALGYSLLSNGLLIFMVPFFITFTNLSFSSGDIYLGLTVIVLRLIMNSYSGYLNVTFRTNSDFNTLSNLKAFLAVFKVLSLFFIVFFNFYGLLMREFLLILIEMLFLHFNRPIRVGISLKRKKLNHLFVVGFPLFLNTYLYSFFESLPKLFLAKYGTEIDLGFFSPVSVVVGLALIVPDSIGSFLYPKLTYSFGQKIGNKKLRSIVYKSILVSLILGIFLFICVNIFSGYISFLLPKYEKSIPYLKIVSFGLIFVGWKSNNYIFAIFKDWRYLYLDTFLLGLVSFSTLYFLSSYSHLDILMVSSLCVVIVMIVMFFITNFFAIILVNKNMHV